MNNGSSAVLKGSHKNDLYDQYDKNGNWTGMLSDEDADTFDMSIVDYLTGNAGSITIHNARALHFSPSSRSKKPRPLLLDCYTSADAKAYTAHPQPTFKTYKVVRGKKIKNGSTMIQDFVKCHPIGRENTSLFFCSPSR